MLGIAFYEVEIKEDSKIDNIKTIEKIEIMLMHINKGKYYFEKFFKDFIRRIEKKWGDMIIPKLSKLIHKMPMQTREEAF